MKLFFRTTLFFIIIILLSFNISAASEKSDDGMFKITYPDIVNPFEPFIVHVKVLDNDVKAADRLEIRYGSIPLIEGEDFNPSSDLKVLGTNNGYVYDKEKSFDIQVSLLQSGGMGLNDMYRGYKETSDLDTDFTIIFLSDEEGIIDSVEAPIKSYPYDISISLPSKYVYEKKDSDLNKLTKTYKVQTDNEYSDVRVKMMLPLALEPSPHFISLEDLQEGRPTSNHWINSGVQEIEDNFEKNSFTLNGYPAVLYSRCGVGCGYESDDRCGYSCEFVGQQATDIGIIRFDMSNDKGPGAWLPKDAAEAKISEWKSLALSAFKSIKYDATGHNDKGKNVEEKDEDEEVFDCTEDSQCDEGYRCTACGECYNEEDIVDPEDVKATFSISTKKSSKSIPNSIREKAKFVPTVKSDFRNNEGKKIDYCEVAMPGLKDYVLISELTNKDHYAELGMGIWQETRTYKQERIMDFSQDETYSTLLFPNNKKKTIGETPDIKEVIEFRVEHSGEVEAKAEDNILLTPLDMGVKIKTSGTELQQDSNKLIQYTVDSKSKDIFVRATLIGPGTIENENYESRKLYSTTKPDVLNKMMYYSPELGNFDLAKEVAGLSMASLQYEAGKVIAQDAALAYAGDWAQNLEDLHKTGKAIKFEKAGVKVFRNFVGKNPGAYSGVKAAEYVKALSAAKAGSKAGDFVGKSFKVYNGAYGLTTIPGSIKTMSKNMDQNGGVPGEHKTTIEKVSEYGVTGINILQTGFGILTFVPSKIPVLGKAAAGLKVAFSAATNIAKADLKYLSKTEKINRAKEKFIPAMIVITMEDESGWTLQKGVLFQIAYSEI